MRNLLSSLRPSLPAGCSALVSHHSSVRTEMRNGLSTASASETWPRREEAGSALLYWIPASTNTTRICRVWTSGTTTGPIISAIAARKDGMLGIAQCDLDVWKVFSDRKENGQRYVDSEMYNRALGLALDGGCSVVNLSLGGTAFDEVEARLIARLIRRGVAVVAAMGNEYEEGNPTEYPAALPDVIAVGGIDQDHERASFSNTGRHICVVAPAVGIRSTIPGTRSTRARYAAWDGTSFAAPQVSGLIGYLLGRGRLLKNSTPVQIRSRIASRATPLPGMRGRRFTPAFGHGLIDLPSLAGRSMKRVHLRRRGP